MMLNKVPEVALYFWVIKILCTTVGATAADFLNTNLNLGLAGTTYVTSAVFAVALFFQFRAATVRAERLLARRRTDQRRRHADHRQPDGQLRRGSGDGHDRVQRWRRSLPGDSASAHSRSTASSPQGGKLSTGWPCWSPLRSARQQAT
jgi:hypothetical protein